MKLVVMVLLGFEVLMILTKRKKALSLIGAFALTFSPAVQWWFMQHVGDLIFFTLGLMIAFIIISTIMIKMATNVDDAFGGYFRYWVYFSDLPSPSSDAGVLADFYFVGLLIYYSKKVSWDLLDVVLIEGQFYLLAESWFISG